MTPSRGKVTITDSGKNVIANPPSIIDVSFLMQFQAFRDFRSRTRDKQDEISVVEEAQDQTPEEMLESGIELIHSKVASELLEIIQVMPPRDFEELVVDLMVALGYGGSFKDAAKAIGGSGDEGVDGIIKEDKLGLDVIYVQAKRHGADNPVGDDHIRNFIGSLVTKSAKKGVFVTTSSFRPKAKDMIKGIDQRIVLIDGYQLTALMIEHGIGVSTVATYYVPKIDSDYFSFLSEEG
jgi:restriction system protein